MWEHFFTNDFDRRLISNVQSSCHKNIDINLHIPLSISCFTYIIRIRHVETSKLNGLLWREKTQRNMFNTAVKSHVFLLYLWCCRDHQDCLEIPCMFWLNFNFHKMLQEDLLTYSYTWQLSFKTNFLKFWKLYQCK